MPDSDAWQTLLHEIDSAWPASRYRDIGVVVGCSGGADSVSLVRALNHLRRSGPNGERPFESREKDTDVDQWADSVPKGFLVVAHFNHGLRGDESDGDEQFVRELASELDLPFEVGRSEGKLDDEQSARNDRRVFFGNVARATGARYIALGHSIDDNVETVLHRLLRGTGPQGMTGISPFRALSDHPADHDFVVCRPMLGVRRALIRMAMQDAGFAWREDRSNHESVYRRNWIRNELIPMVEQQNPHAVPAVSRFIEGQQQWADVIDSLVERWMERYLISSEPLTIAIPSPPRDASRKVAKATAKQSIENSQAVAIEALRRCWMSRQWPLQAMGQSQWAMLYEHLNGNGPDVVTLPGAIRASRKDGQVQFRRNLPTSDPSGFV